jgi:hypothetical protein
MIPTRMTLCVLAICTMAGSTGCISLLGPEDLRFRLSLLNGVGIDREFALGVDGLTLQAAAAFAPVDVPLGGVYWTDFGTFKIRGDAKGLISNARLPGYESIVRVREDGEEVNVLVKQSDTAIKSFVVLAREGDELVIVRMHGRIDKLLQQIMEDGAFGIKPSEILKSPPEPPEPPHPPPIEA